MAERTICPCMAAPKQIKGGAVNDAGCTWSWRSGHAVSGTGSTGNTASHSRHPRVPAQSRRHNDQEYDIIYYLQGGDMWHIGKYSETTHLSDYFGYFWRYSALKSLDVAPLAMPAFFALPIAKITSN